MTDGKSADRERYWRWNPALESGAGIRCSR
jgi:hypothetical protein